eukprot:6456732-Amphidinium_carterae.1
MLNNTQHTVNRAQLQTAASDVVSFFIFADAACRTPFSSHVKLDVTVGPLHCEQGLNFTCSCEGDKKAISGELYEPTCSDRSVVYTIPPYEAEKRNHVARNEQTVNAEANSSWSASNMEHS